MKAATIKSHYDGWVDKLVDQGASLEQATISVIHRYLDGKPTDTSPTKRDAAFWSSAFWTTCTDEIFRTEAFTLALAKYLSRAGSDDFGELRRALAVAPVACKRAARYSRAFLNPESTRWGQFEGHVRSGLKGYNRFLKDCRALWQRYKHLNRETEHAFDSLRNLPLLDLLVIASASAFKTELPPLFGLAPPNAVIPLPQFRYPAFGLAVSRLLSRRLCSCAQGEFEVTEDCIRTSFQRYLYPLLLPHYADGGACAKTLRLFETYIDAQLRLDAFSQRDVIRFCFEHSQEDERQAVDTDTSLSLGVGFPAWVKSQIRGQILMDYWQGIGRSLYEESTAGSDNSLHDHEGAEATTAAVSSLAMLHEIFGMDDEVSIGNGSTIRLEQACFALHLAHVHFKRTLLIPFAVEMRRHGDWATALRDIIDGGIFEGLQQRYPILFGTHAEKLSMMLPYTVSEDHPVGDEDAASAILSFLTNEFKTGSDLLHRDQRQLLGSLTELPFLKLGNYIFTLPWALSTQDVPTALVNNLRRVRTQRPGTTDETHRIEERLATRLNEMGFRTVVGHEPPDGDEEPPGEIDLIASRDGHLFMLEIKSGYIRETFEAAWHHRTSTLRKAGRQLQRKLEAIRRDFPADLRDALGLAAFPADQAMVHSWIVDTSVDFGGERFSGHPKISMTELLVVLSDCAGTLSDDAPETLYPDGFSAATFADILENERIWAELDIP
jgi:Holliday junction resolvase-like predicted endonuclease